MADDTSPDESPAPDGSTSRRHLFRVAGTAAGALAGGGLLSVLRAGPAAAVHAPQETSTFEIFNNPLRQYDSRMPTSPGGSPTGMLVGGADGTTRTIVVPVANPPIPEGESDEDINAILVNMTVADTGGVGFLIVHPTGVARPGTSIINWWGPGQIHANQVVTAVAGAPFGPKSIDVYISPNSSCHLILDVYGYYDSGLTPPAS